MKKQPRKGNNPRRRKGTKTSVMLNRYSAFGGNTVPDRMMVELNYCTGSYTASGVTSDAVFRGNSAFDPDFTGVGHQPLGFDQYSAFYGSYRVHSSSIECTTVCISTVYGSLFVVVPTLSSTSYALTTVDNACEQRFSKFRQISNLGGDAITLKSKQTSKSMLGLDPSRDINQIAAISANPVTAWYWHVINQANDLLSAQNCSVVVRLVYLIEFLNPLTLTES